MQLRLICSSWSFCFYLPSARTTTSPHATNELFSKINTFVYSLRSPYSVLVTFTSISSSLLPVHLPNFPFFLFSFQFNNTLTSVCMSHILLGARLSTCSWSSHTIKENGLALPEKPSVVHRSPFYARIPLTHVGLVKATTGVVEFLSTTVLFVQMIPLESPWPLAPKVFPPSLLQWSLSLEERVWQDAPYVAV